MTRQMQQSRPTGRTARLGGSAGPACIRTDGPPPPEQYATGVGVIASLPAYASRLPALGAPCCSIGRKLTARHAQGGLFHPVIAIQSLLLASDRHEQ